MRDFKIVFRTTVTSHPVTCKYVSGSAIGSAVCRSYVGDAHVKLYTTLVAVKSTDTALAVT